MNCYNEIGGWFDKNAENPFTPAAYSWPSTMNDNHLTELKNEIQRLVKLLGLKTSVYNIETRECVNGKSYIMECSPRGGENRLSEMVRYVTGVDMITSAVQVAVGLPIHRMKPRKIDGFWSMIVLHSTQVGIFKSLWLDDAISSNVFEKDLWIKPGVKVGAFKGANEAIGSLVLKFEDEKSMLEVMNNRDKYVKIVIE